MTAECGELGIPVFVNVTGHNRMDPDGTTLEVLHYDSFDVFWSAEQEYLRSMLRRIATQFGFDVIFREEEGQIGIVADCVERMKRKSANKALVEQLKRERERQIVNNNVTMECCPRCGYQRLAETHLAAGEVQV